MAVVDRRELTLTLGLAAAAGLVRPRALFGAGQRATVFDWQPINDSMRVAFGAGGNVLAVAGGGNLLLVDTKHVGYGQVLRAEAEAFAGPLQRVVNTHHHPDHIGGNPFFTGEVPVISQSRGTQRAASFGSETLIGIRQDPVGRLEQMTLQVRNMDISPDAKNAGSESMAAFAAMAGDLEPADFSATETFDDALEISVGATRVELRHIDRGHTDNDIFAYFPEANVLHGGDLFFNGLHPRIDVSADATTVGWQRCLTAMIDVVNADTVCIPGHGPLSDIDGLRSFYEYFDILRAFVQQQIDGGHTREQIMEMGVPQFAEWDSARLPANLGTIYDELMAAA
jgi:glyoxylase-like metal-dependent hydrolase (beta-lactamase superfamily II)